MSAFLKALAWVAPNAALKRARAFASLDASARYAGATTGRRGASFLGGGQSANSAVGSHLTRLRERSHEMARDHWAFSRILDVLVSHSVGHGIQIQPDNGSDRLDRQVGDMFAEWSESADVTGEGDLHGLVALAVRGMFEGGNSLMRFVPQRIEDGGRRVPLALHLLEGEHLDHTRDGEIEGRRTRLGVSVGEFDRRLGYWLHPEHPGESSVGTRGQQISVFHPRADVIHLYRPLRASQLVGVPIFAPILITARDLADLMDAILIKAKVEACFSAFVTKNGDVGALDAMTEPGASGRPPITEFAPGMIARLNEGEDIKFAQPSSTSGFESVQSQALYAMAAGAGITYDQLNGDLRQANYSSLRAGKIEFRRLIEQIQWLTIIPRVHSRITARWTDTAIAAGMLRERRDGYRWKYVPPANEPIDPKKDLDADINAVRAGRMSPQEFIGAWGRDWRTVIRDFQTFFKETDGANLIFDIDPRTTGRAGQEKGNSPAPAPAPDDE